MPTIFSHAVIPIAIGFALGRVRIPVPLLAAGIIVSALPDADVAGLKYGIEYADQFGHRGASHAVLVAAIVAAFLASLLRPKNWRLAFGFLFFSMASHGILDAFTSGGLGPALLWPFDTERFFAPITPIRVSPIGMGFFSSRGIAVLVSEALWIWMPFCFAALAVKLALRRKA